ncbi:MAG: hypothetical protein ACYDHE_11330 [Candidatus Acidiferrales bacterium]
MDHQVYLRPYNSKNAPEKKLFIEWLYAQRELNRFDPELFTREQVKVYTLFDRQMGIVGFTTVGVVYLMDYQIFRPGLADSIKASALKSVQHFLVFKAGENNVPSAFFRPSDERYSNFAQNYGWKEDKLLWLRFADLEKVEAEETHEDHN